MSLKGFNIGKTGEYQRFGPKNIKMGHILDKTSYDTLFERFESALSKLQENANNAAQLQAQDSLVEQLAEREDEIADLNTKLESQSNSADAKMREIRMRNAALLQQNESLSEKLSAQDNQQDKMAEFMAQREEDLAAVDAVIHKLKPYLGE